MATTPTPDESIDDSPTHIEYGYAIGNDGGPYNGPTFRTPDELIEAWPQASGRDLCRYRVVGD